MSRAAIQVLEQVEAHLSGMCGCIAKAMDADCADALDRVFDSYNDELLETVGQIRQGLEIQAALEELKASALELKTRVDEIAKRESDREAEDRMHARAEHFRKTGRLR